MSGDATDGTYALDPGGATIDSFCIYPDSETTAPTDVKLVTDWKGGTGGNAFFSIVSCWQGVDTFYQAKYDNYSQAEDMRFRKYESGSYTGIDTATISGGLGTGWSKLMVEMWRDGGGDYRMRFSQSTDGGSSWTTLCELADNNPSIAGGGFGIAGSQSYDTTAIYDQTEIYY